jgi:hypothetical protein
MRRVDSRNTLAAETIRSTDRCVEVGVFRGDFTQTILPMCGHLLAIDLWLDGMSYLENGEWKPCDGDDAMEHYCQRFATQIASGKLETCREDSAEAIASLPDQSVDWVYIDASHDFEAVLADLEAALPKTRRWICGHDYCEICDFSVVRAVSVFCDRHGLTVDYLTEEPRLPVHEQEWTTAYDSFAINVERK